MLSGNYPTEAAIGQCWHIQRLICAVLQPGGVWLEPVGAGAIGL